MTHQPDLFGELASTRSFPPHLDPLRAADWTVERDMDRDHVAPAVNGIIPVGALGSNQETWLAQVLDAAGEVLASFPFETREGAFAKLDELRATTNSNRQGFLL